MSMPSRSQSRSSSRNKSPAPAMPNLNITMSGGGLAPKKSTKFPMILNASPSEEYLSPSPVSPSMTANNSTTSLLQSGLVVGATSQQGKRPYQEDEYHVRHFLTAQNGTHSEDDKVETHFFGLFDGHAGGKCSKYISTALANTIADDHQFMTNLPQALKRSFHTANEQFLKIAEKMKLHDGSTGIVAIVRDTKVLVANVGDCRCLIVSGGRAIQMSIDQKPTDPNEQKRIQALGGQVVYCMGVARVNRVLAVSRAFGNRTLRTVIKPDAEMMQRELTKEDDYLVMASDGLWDVLKNKDVCDVCYSQFLQGNQQSISEELVNLALNRGSMDNVTCVVVKLNDYVHRITSNGAPKTNPNATYPGIQPSNGLTNQSTAKLERQGSIQAALARNNSETFYGNNAVATTPTNLIHASDGSGKRLATLINGNNSGNAGTNVSVPYKQYSLGSIKPSDLPASSASYNNGFTGGHQQEASAAENQQGYLIKRVATPNRMAPISTNPYPNNAASGGSNGGNGGNSAYTSGSPKMLKSLTASNPSELFVGSDQEGSPSAGYAEKQEDSPPLFSISNKQNSMKNIKNSGISQSFGPSSSNSNMGSGNNSAANGVSLIHDDLSASLKRPNSSSVHARSFGGQQPLSVQGQSQSQQQSQQQQQQQLYAGSMSPSISHYNQSQQQQHSGFAAKKVPNTLNWPTDPSYSAGPDQQQHGGSGGMPPIAMTNGSPYHLAKKQFGSKH